MTKTIRIKPGQVWTCRAKNSRTLSRRVIGVAAGRVCYSSGGDHTRWCQPRAFRLWIRRYQAKRARPNRQRCLALVKERAR